MRAFVNGAVVEESSAQLKLFDHGFTVGDGVFETIALRNGAPQALTRHVARLARSAARLGLPRVEVDALCSAVRETVHANPPVAWGAVRITYSSGPGPMGSARGDGGPTTVVAVRETKRPDLLAEVITVPWPRNERGALAGVKTTSYAENALALADAHRQGASEAIFANTRGELCEGSGSNIFLVLNGELLTPPLSSGCLAGVSRGLLIERCGLDVVERDIPSEMLYLADEAFLTSATRDVQPIRSVDGRALATCPGRITERAAARYGQVMADDPDPAAVDAYSR